MKTSNTLKFQKCRLLISQKIRVLYFQTHVVGTLGNTYSVHHSTARGPQAPKLLIICKYFLTGV